ncbi:MAG TPA: sigma-70 family RNA polymerase sigma factor [Thermoplasmata archaeon]|nr:sigma-70 family RNA polymerase sigma factor [Thermoplasmata archaeon]
MGDAETVVDAGGATPHPARLEVLYARHASDAARLAYLLTGDPEVARDLVHDAFLRLVTRFVDLRSEDSFEAYLRAMVVNLSKMHFRRQTLERRHTSGANPQLSHAPPIEDRDLLRRALLGLPERQRTAIVLRYYLDLSEKTTAETMRCRQGTVKSLTSRGMTALRSVLGDG